MVNHRLPSLSMAALVSSVSVIATLLVLQISPSTLSLVFYSNCNRALEDLLTTRSDKLLRSGTGRGAHGRTGVNATAKTISGQDDAAPPSGKLPPRQGSSAERLPYWLKQRELVWSEASGGRVVGPSFPKDQKTFREMLTASVIMQGLTPTVSCRQRRYGILGDGGKVLCDVERLLGGPDCLVYSFGIQTTVVVEEEIRKLHPNCQLVLFDPTSERFFSKAETCKHPNVKCLPIALGGGEQTSTQLGMAGLSLDTIMRGLGHTGRKLNVLKMDIEGSEYEVIEHYMQSNKFENVNLLLMEIHNVHLPEFQERLKKVFRWLSERGLDVYYLERNPYFAYTGAEVALINRTMLSD